MDHIFGVSLTTIMISLLVALAAIAVAIVWIAVRNPLLVRMGVRNIARRPAQTALIVVGLMFATLLISASFTTGDTIAHSITEDVYRSFERADIIIEVDRDSAPGGLLREEHLQMIREALGNDPGIDTISPAFLLSAPAVNEEQRRSDPGAQLVGLDGHTVDALDGLQLADGGLVSLSDLGEHQSFVTERTARETASEAGSTITVFVNQEPHRFEVHAVIRDTIPSGSEPAGLMGPFESLSGRVVTHIDTVREIAGEPDAFTNILVSLRGEARDTVDAIPAMEERLERLLVEAQIPAEVLFTKEQGVAAAELIGAGFMTIFLVLGLFSLAAGILLIFLIFVMLAAERRQEMGVSRAVGMKRLHLTETFIAEGMAYNLGAALVGVLLGVVAAYALTTVMLWIWSDFEMQAAFRVNPEGIVVAYALGVVITFLTVAGAAWRAANLTIVSAVRDLPERPPLHGRNPSIPGLGRSMLGVLWYLAWIGLVTFWVIVAIPVFFLGLATYGAAYAVGGLVIGFYMFGARETTVPFRAPRAWWRRLLYLLWWGVFSALALLTWFLFRTREWARRHRDAGGWALWMLLGGAALLYFGGWHWGDMAAYRGGFTFTLLALAMLTVYFGLPTRPVLSLVSLGLLWYWMLPLPFSLLMETGTRFDPLDGALRVLGLPRPLDVEGRVEMFFVAGIAMVTAATLFVVFTADLILKPVDRLGGILRGLSPAFRTAVAYPLAARLRTGMTLAMFGLVIFSLTVISVISHNFQQFIISDDARAGFDIMVTGNEANRIDDLGATLDQAEPSAGEAIHGAGRLRQATARARVIGHEGELAEIGVRGLDDQYLRLAELPLRSRASGYDSDHEVFAAMRTDERLAVVNTNVLGDLAVPTALRPALDDNGWSPLTVAIREETSNEVFEVTIVGILSDAPFELMGWPMRGLFLHDAGFERIAGMGTHDRFFVTLASGSAEATTVAGEIESALLEHGIHAISLEQLGEDLVAQFGGIWTLFEGFMGLGLIVGIAALGVIAARTVVERRQEIGMLRAIGYSRWLIATSFFFEWSFIALAGITIGIGLGAALAHILLTGPDFPVDEVAVPWLRLITLAAITYGASVLMTIAPTRAATRVPVADALRYE